MTERSFNEEGANTTDVDNGQGGAQGPSFDSGSQGNNDQMRQGAQQDQGGSKNLEEQIRVLEKRLSDKDEFIETLKNERRGDGETINSLKEKVESLTERSNSVEEILERMRASQGRENEDGSRLTPEEARKLAEEEARNVYTQQRTAEERKTNFESVRNDLLSAYGNEKVDEEVGKVAQELGMTFDEAFDMAETRPSAFRRLFIPQSKPRGEPNAPGGDVNTSAFSDTTPTKPRKTLAEIGNEKERVKALQERFRNLS